MARRVLAVVCCLALACALETDPYLKKLDEAISQYKEGSGDKVTRDFDNELGITFTCDVNSVKQRPRATNVHELGPGDVDVVAAIGDSITAGNGLAAGNLAGVLIQNRGESWSVGGEGTLENVITFTNAIRQYNPEVKGYSMGKGGQGGADSWFNRAVPGAIASNMPNQATDLINKLKEDDRIDYENDWKVVTLHIGGNDLCSYCYDRDRYSPDNFEMHIQEALDRLHAEVPRMFVNLVALFDVTNIRDISTGLVCDGMQASICGCSHNPETNPEMRPTQLAYAQRLDALAASGRYDTRDDFTVVSQRSLTDITDPPTDPDTGEVDPAWFSYDCFHPDRRTHQLMALNLWNTMFIPVGDKPGLPPPDTEEFTFTCPTPENPYFATNNNRKSQKRMAIPVLFQGVDNDDQPEVSPLATVGAVLGACAFVAVAMATVLVVKKKRGKRMKTGEVEMKCGGQVNPACDQA